MLNWNVIVFISPMFYFTLFCWLLLKYNYYNDKNDDDKNTSNNNNYKGFLVIIKVKVKFYLILRKKKPLIIIRKWPKDLPPQVLSNRNLDNSHDGASCSPPHPPIINHERVCDRVLYKFRKGKKGSLSNI